MKYFLPITINGRRLHICNLEEQTADYKPKPTFSFIINNGGNHLQVLSVNTNDAKLISTDGYANDVELSNLYTSIEFVENEVDNLPTFYVNIVKGKEHKYELNGLVPNGSFTNKDNHFHIDIDKTVMTSKTDSFVVVLGYKANGKEYSYAFKIHLCAQDNLLEAAMDFGSEASQILIKSDGTNMRLIKEFHKFHDQYKNKTEFWQGNLDDKFYKSIFFLHKNPDKTEYAEPPNKNKNKTHIQTLLPKDLNADEFKDLEILPNMKLIELLDLSNQSTFDFEITFKDGSPHDNTNSTSFANKKTREGTLRLILSNFLYCILENKIIQNYNGRKRFLRLVILMPNVYYQKKVYSIIKDLYNDFNKIITNQKYSQYGGIEIQMISESDAAFVGTKKDQSVQRIDASNGYFLVIDAGKGTTDFSILKQYPNFSKFDSVYRAGIPASGHILTYAFYEAIRDYLNSQGITLNDKLLEASRVTLLKFMLCVEEFKIHFETSQNKEISKKLELRSYDNLEQIIVFLQTLIDDKTRIPNSEIKVEQKINELVGKIKEAIGYGVKSFSGYQKFEQVLLTGRGFLFEKFKSAVKKMLIKEQWIENDKLIFSYSSDRAKSICLTGAFSTTNEIEINKNSELIGRPIIQRRKDAKANWFIGTVAGNRILMITMLSIALLLLFLIIKHYFSELGSSLINEIDVKLLTLVLLIPILVGFLPKKIWLSRVIKNLSKSVNNCIDYLRSVFNKSDENLDTEFFYNGLKTNLQNPLMRVGGKEATPNLLDYEEKRLYFIGDGFVFQTKNGIIKFEEDYLNSELSPLVMQTLFPFFKGSIPEKETITTIDKQTDRTESTEEKLETITPPAEHDSTEDKVKEIKSNAVNPEK